MSSSVDGGSSMQVARVGRHPLELQFPVDPRPRYGHGKPPHERLYGLLNEGRAQYEQRLESFLDFEAELRRIPLHAPEDSHRPSYLSTRWLGGLDIVALYATVAERAPRTYLEIGSGLSTKVARTAIRNHGLATRIVSLDPEPRAWIDGLCDHVVRQPLEQVDLAIFDTLEAGDVLFFDGSHVCLMNTDVTVFFLEVLPRLKPGVVVQIHDIWLPYDYPLELRLPDGSVRPWYGRRNYSEQYLLAVHLLALGSEAKVLLPNQFVTHDPALSAVLDPLWNSLELRPVRRAGMARGSSFWMETGRSARAAASGSPIRLL